MRGRFLMPRSTAHLSRGALSFEGTSDFEQNGQIFTLKVTLNGDSRQEQRS